MKSSSIASVFAVLATLATLVPDRAAAASQDYFIFRASITIPATTVSIGEGANFDKLVKRTFKTDDVINLALGRAPKTKIEKTLMLAVATYFEDGDRPIANPISRLVVYDKAAMGPNRIKAVVARLDSLDYVNAYQKSRNSGLGFATGHLVATTLGEPAKYGLLETTVTGSGLVSGGHSTIPTQQNNFQQQFTTEIGSVTFQGHLKFNTTDSGGTTTVYDGLVSRGILMFSGKLVDTVTIND